MSVHGIVTSILTIFATSLLYCVSGGLVSLFVLFYGLTMLNAIVTTELYGPALERN
jgi:hypothetical protein